MRYEVQFPIKQDSDCQGEMYDRHTLTRFQQMNMFSLSRTHICCIYWFWLHDSSAPLLNNWPISVPPVCHRTDWPRFHWSRHIQAATWAGSTRPAGGESQSVKPLKYSQVLINDYESIQRPKYYHWPLHDFWIFWGHLKYESRHNWLQEFSTSRSSAFLILSFEDRCIPG